MVWKKQPSLMGRAHKKWLIYVARSFEERQEARRRFWKVFELMALVFMTH
jgi:hypothetical protein